MKNFFRSAALGLGLATASVPAIAQTNTPYPFQGEQHYTVDVYYNRFKNIANEYNYWDIMRQIRLSDAQLQGPVARLNLMMDAISNGRYDYNNDAKRELTICVAHDMAHILDIVNLGHRGLKVWRNLASNALFHLEQQTGDFSTRHNCPRVYDHRVAPYN